MGQERQEGEKKARPVIRIGTSGYSYRGWVGPVYPPGTKSRDMLAAYSREFDTVELNYSFYRMPYENTSAGMARNTPEGFLFFVKAHRSFTHEGELGGKEQFLAGIAPLIEAGKCAGILFQFPQSFRRSKSNGAYLVKLGELFADSPAGANAVEFRHESWAGQDVYRYLAKVGFSVVSVDVPPIPSLFPPEAIATGRIAYLRFHSRNAKNWYGGGAVRYDYLYSEEELREWMPGIEKMLQTAGALFVFFNNCHRGQAAENARMMKTIVDSLPS